MPNEYLSTHETAARNMGQFTGFDETYIPQPEYFVYIYSVSKRAYVVHTGLLKSLALRGIAANERYCLCAQIPHPFYQAVPNVENGRLHHVQTHGLMAAMDAVNPANLTGDQDLDTSPTEAADGANLNTRGIFWSLNNPPTESELTAAENRLQRRKQTLVDKVLNTARSSPKDLQYVLNEDSREALDDLGVETDFHRRPTTKVTCPNCAEIIPQLAKFHRSELLGMICVMPNAEAWRAAVRAGVKKLKDVPEEFQEGLPDLVA